MAEKKSIAERVREIADPVAEQLGLSVWDVFYGKEGQNMIMRITIDKPEGIGIQDCESMSRAVDPLIDEAKVSIECEVDGNYELEHFDHFPAWEEGYAQTNSSSCGTAGP